MRDYIRNMELQHGADLCGVDAATYAAAVECVQKELEISRGIAAILLKHFPGYPWEIKTEMERAASMVRLPIMPPNVYYIMPFAHLLDGPSLMEKTVKNAGGELLERFKLSRDGIKFHEFEEARPRPLPKLPGLGGVSYATSAPPAVNDNSNKPKLILPN